MMMFAMRSIAKTLMKVTVILAVLIDVKISERLTEWRKILKKKEINPGLRIKYKLIQEVESQVATWEEEKTELEDELILRKSEMLKLEYELNALKVKNQEDMAKTNCPSCIQELTSLKLDISVLKYE